MGRQPREVKIVQAASQEAALAARLYNDPSVSRSLEAFIVHMNLAWLYLLQAEFTRDHVDFRYRDPKHPNRLQYINDGSVPRGKGEAKRWELAKCLKERWVNDHDPVRTNIDFFIALRNRIEHRHLSSDSSLELVVCGKAQALLFNFEEEIVSQFGASWSLASVLRFPVFIGTFSPEGQETLLRLQNKLPSELRKFIVDYDAGLTRETQEDQRFEFRPRVVLEKGVRGPDSLIMQFTRPEDMTDEELAATEQLGKRGQALIVEKTRAVASADKLKPSQVVKCVASAIPFRFAITDHTYAWKHEAIRPEGGSAHPEGTKEQYCVFDKPHGDYLYTSTWAQRLIAKYQTVDGFREMTGREPVMKRDE
ncbi:MAG: DUF3644 domain-containing protein [Propionibacteriaceae bacterium]|jgi:hypothetical protein|nr:DUF3644 domain-containing protein [Propionibacteriaceae bacterium]